MLETLPMSEETGKKTTKKQGMLREMRKHGHSKKNYIYFYQFILSTYWSSSHLISYLLVSWRKILGDAQAESDIFLQLTNKYDIRCEKDQ